MKILLKGIYSTENSNKLTSLALKNEEKEGNFNITEIKSLIIDNFKDINEDILNRDFSLYSNGNFLIPEDSIKIKNNQIIEIKFTLFGGKGGFGSLLKGQPPVKKRTNNFDSCRDLSGRRLRHVNQEKMLSDWEQKKLEEEKMLKEYTNPNEKSNASNYVEKLHHKEIEAINTNFKYDNYEVTESISSSMKYLMRKKLREKSNHAKIEKLELREFNDKKIKEHNNFNFENFKEDVQRKMNNSYSIFGNTMKIKDKQIKTENDIVLKNNDKFSNTNKSKLNIILKSNERILDLDLTEDKAKEIISKKDKDNADNLSQLSDASETSLNKEELEKELLEL